MKKQHCILLAIINAVAFIGVVVVNALANALPINGYNTGELSDMYPNLFVPAGFTFSIWGVIYLLLGLFIIYQLVVAFREASDPGVSGTSGAAGRTGGAAAAGSYSGGFLEKISLLFVVTSAANIGWVFAWHYALVGISLIAMLVLLISLMLIYLRLDIRKRQTTAAEKWLVFVPFSVYFGWITVATIANVTALLVDLGWNGFGISEPVWTIVVIVVGTLIGLAVLFSRQDIYYALVIEWAYFGILMKRIQSDGQIYTSIVVTVAVCMGIILLGMVFQLIKKRVY